jgi:hypothetical protein
MRGFWIIPEELVLFLVLSAISIIFQSEKCWPKIELVAVFSMPFVLFINECNVLLAIYRGGNNRAKRIYSIWDYMLKAEASSWEKEKPS